jgi:hypothetical protein
LNDIWTVKEEKKMAQLEKEIIEANNYYLNLKRDKF